METDYLTGEIHYKIKGLTLAKCEDKNEQARLRAQQFEDSLHGNDIKQMRIVGLKQSLKGKYEVNEIMYITKKFDLNDTKRIWLKKYSKHGMKDSRPLICGFNNVKELMDYYNTL